MSRIKKKAVAVKKAPARKDTQIATVAADQPMSPIQQMQAMKSMGLEVSDMREMLQLQKEYEANEAQKLFNDEMAAFKAEEIKITKDKTVSYDTDKGTTAYDHASLANIVDTAVPFLSKHGFSHNWKTDQLDGGMIRVTCTITHRAGHSESTSLQSSRDDSGGKNNIQGIGSAITYLQRYTFLALTGLAAHDQDDDARAAETLVELISTDQLIVLNDLLDETQSDHAKFLAACNVDALSHLPAARYEAAKKALENKKALTS